MIFCKIPELPEFEIARTGEVRRRGGTRVYSSFRDTTGYVRIALGGRDNQKIYYVHRLLARTYLKGFAPGSAVNHKNGVKTDNRLSNLEWVSYSQNMRHSFLTGLRKAPQGSQVKSALLNEDQVRQIKKMLQLGVVSQKEIGVKFGVSRSTILNIHRGACWRHVT